MATSTVEATPLERADSSQGLYTFFALACVTTWLLAIPAARAWIEHQSPPPFAIACAGLSAFGPLLAALVAAAPRRQLRDVFGRWRTSPLWVVLALLAAPAIHLCATALYAAIGGQPEAWFHPPANAEQIAAAVVFPIGEEFGWRGFAQPRMERRFGPVAGTLWLGGVWGLWHLAYAITPAAAGFDALEFALSMIELPLYSLPIAWLFGRADRSMAVAIAFHAGAHLDHLERASRADLRLHGIHIAVVALVASVAARALRRRALHGGRTGEPKS